MSTKAEIRAAILGIKPKSKIITVAGVEIELRQPSIGVIITGDVIDRKATIVKMLTDYAYVPGTGEAIFDANDAEAILEMPFGGDYQAINAAVDELTNLGSISEEEMGNSPATSEE